MVVVVDVDEPAQPEVAGQRRRLVADALLEVAVAADDEGVVVAQLGPEAGPQQPLGHPHAHAVGEALAEGAGRDLDPGGPVALGVARGAAAPLAELLEVVEGEPVAGRGRASSTAGSRRGRWRARSGPGRASAGRSGRWRMIRVHSTWASGASAMAVPGWPELACWGASMARPRMTLMPSCSSSASRSNGLDRLHVFTIPSQAGGGVVRTRAAVHRPRGNSGAAGATSRVAAVTPRVMQVPPNSDLTLGMVCIDKDRPGRTVWRMRADERFENPGGLIQGGFLAAFADSSMGAAAVTWVGDRKVLVANAELKISFLAAGADG